MKTLASMWKTRTYVHYGSHYLPVQAAFLLLVDPAVWAVAGAVAGVPLEKDFVYYHWSNQVSPAKFLSAVRELLRRP